ncbi:MAG: tRNA-binding protein [Candidatus Cloacimonetes bacterium]|nr:tRNA-binding protein [Candidatus Cloacimonadota bacterium]
MSTYDNFLKLDIRIGKIISVDDFPRARKTSYKMKINFGEEIGVKNTSIQATNYTKEELLGKQIVGVVNFPPKNIAGFFSEVLVLGVPTEENELSLLEPSKKAKLGGRVY